MNAKPGRICLLLALLSLSLAAALSIGLNARQNGVTVQATMNAYVAMMQPQSSPDSDEGSVAPESEANEGDKTVTCAQAAPRCPSPKQELALALSDDRQAHESKARESKAQDSKTFAAPSDEIPSKSRD